MCRDYCRKSICSFVLLLSLLWSLVEVSSQQIFPYVSFMDQTLANHSYICGPQSSGSGGSGSNSVRCHIDLQTCCSSTQGSHREDWYFPNRIILLFSGSGDIFKHHTAQRFDLRCRNSATSPVGIYRCDIQTNIIHDGDDNSVRETVYVGLYTTSGGKQPYYYATSDNKFG